MDEVKWAWVLFLAATLALLIRLSMWFLPAPGWRTEKVDRAAEVVSAAGGNESLPFYTPLSYLVVLSGIVTLGSGIRKFARRNIAL